MISTVSATDVLSLKNAIDELLMLRYSLDKTEGIISPREGKTKTLLSVFSFSSVNTKQLVTETRDTKGLDKLVDELELVLDVKRSKQKSELHLDIKSGKEIYSNEEKLNQSDLLLFPPTASKTIEEQIKFASNSVHKFATEALKRSDLFHFNKTMSNKKGEIMVF